MGDYMIKELFLLFVFGSIIGTIYETILTLVSNYNKYKCFRRSIYYMILYTLG